MTTCVVFTTIIWSSINICDHLCSIYLAGSLKSHPACRPWQVNQSPLRRSGYAVCWAANISQDTQDREQGRTKKDYTELNISLQDNVGHKDATQA